MTNNKFIKLWLPVYLYAGLIFILSSRPQPEKLALFPNADKAVHIVEYAVLGALLIRAFWRSDYGWSIYKCVGISVAAACLYGISDELHQHFVPTRIASGWDVLSDSIGAFIGAIIYKNKSGDAC